MSKIIQGMTVYQFSYWWRKATGQSESTNLTEMAALQTTIVHFLEMLEREHGKP